MSVWPNGKPEVGDSARRERTVRAEDIALFTEMTGDRNPLHYDRHLAERSRFGGIIVQGGVTSGLLNALVAEDLPGPGTVFLEANWRFIAPVMPGDKLVAEAHITGVRDDKPIAELTTTITRAGDGAVVLEGTVVCFTDPTVACAKASTSTREE